MASEVMELNGGSVRDVRLGSHNTCHPKQS
jgi:hypothetical protein